MSATAYLVAAVTPSDTVNIVSGPVRALYVGVGGDVAIYSPGTALSVVLKNVSSGQVLPVACLRVLATGTTATDIVALF